MLEFLILIIFLISLLLLIGALLFFQPRWILAKLESRSPGVVFFARTQKPMVALTLDDGPDPAVTPEILDLLACHDARGTFFLFSESIYGNETVVRRIVEEGHEIGNHLSDDTASIRLPPVIFDKALYDSHQILSEFGDVNWFRPGSGWYNRRMIRTAKNLGYQVALGSVFAYDSHLPLPWFVKLHLSVNASPGDIIALHDRGERGRRTLTVLEQILPELRDRGFQVATLSDLMSES